MNYFFTGVMAMAVGLTALCSVAAELTPTRFSDVSGGGALLLSGKTLYAVQGGKLCAFDVTVPSAPKLMGSVGCAGNRQMAKSGSYLYVSCRASGVQVFDISEAASPKLVNHFYPVELATGLTASGNVLGVTLRIYGVELFDISNPLAPRSMGLMRTDEAQSAMFFGDGKIAVGDWGSGKLVIGDVSVPSCPRVLSRSRLDGVGDGVAVQGHYAYASTGHHSKTMPMPEGEGLGHGLEIFDIADVTKPVKVGGVKFAKLGVVGCDWWSVVPVGGTAFCADTQNGLYVVDISNPAAPRILDHGVLPKKDYASQLAVGDGVVYVSGRSTGLYLFEHAHARPAELPPARVNPCAAPTTQDVPGLRNLRLPGFVWRVTVDGDTLYASGGMDGLHELAIAADGTLTRTAFHEGRCFDCAVWGDMLFLARDTHLEIVDRRSFATLGKLPAKYGYPFFQLHVMYGGKMLTNNSRTSALQFVDVSDPRNPKLVSSESHGGILYGDMVPEGDIGGMLAVNRHSSGLCWHRMDKRPELLEHRFRELKSNQQCGITRLDGHFLRLCGRYAELYEPAQPDKPTRIKMPTCFGIPTADGADVVAISDRRNGIVSVFGFKDDALTPIAGRKYELRFTVTDRVAFHNHRAYIPAGLFGVYFE